MGRGRRPIIREAIIKVLKYFDFPIGFGRIRLEVAKILNRQLKDVMPGNINDNLKKLMEKGQVVRLSTKGKHTYILSNSFFLTKNITVIKSIVDSTDFNDFIPHLEEEITPPVTVYIKNLEKVIAPNRVIKFFTKETERQNWSDPVDLISNRMLITFMDMPVEIRDGIKNLLAYAYWYGVQSFIRGSEKTALERVLKEKKNRALEHIEEVKKIGDTRWIDVEKKLIKILEITEEVTSKKNLSELLNFLKQEEPEIRKLQKQLILLTYEPLNRGENYYDYFLDVHSRVLEGIAHAEFIPKNVKIISKYPGYRYLVNYSDVWNRFISEVFSRFNFENEFEKIGQNMKETLVTIKKCEKYLWALMELPYRSEMFLVYLWGYLEIFQISEKEFLPMYQKWFSALKSGYLNHRSWLFDKETIATLINTLKIVRRDIKSLDNSKSSDKIRLRRFISPPDGIIDFVPWTIKYLYEYHPRGKDVDFWEELLIEINLQMQRKPSKRDLCRHISAALEGRY